MMIDKIERQNRIVEIDARNAMTNEPANIDGWPDMGEGSMGCRIGDEIHNHHYHSVPPPPPQQGETQVTEGRELPTAEELPEKSFLSKALPYVGMALLGGGGVVGIDFVRSFFADDPPASEYLDTDTTRRIDAEVFGPGEG
jgi:hypothetical protein